MSDSFRNYTPPITDGTTMALATGWVVRQMFLDNAGTFPLFLSAPPPPELSCATLGRLKVHTLVIADERTQRDYASISEATVRCTPGSHLVTIGPHLW